MLSSLVYGLTLPIRSAKLIVSHPNLIAWSMLPIGITTALYSWGIVRLNEWLSAILTTHSGGFAASFLHAVTTLLLLLLAAITFSFVAAVAAAPFNDFLAEAAEEFATPPLQRVRNRSLLIRARLILIDTLRSVAAGAAGLAALLLSWVPALSILVFVLTFLLISFQYISYPQVRRGVGIEGGVRFLLRHFPACLGFGAATAALFAIPLVSCFCLPLAVVGGTLLVAHTEGQKTDAI
jgi:uncharacterized protein involved in cysteine biosynthesis